jgi:hypothetical protein
MVSKMAEGMMERKVSSKSRVKSNLPGAVGPKEVVEYPCADWFKDMKR